MTMAKMMIPGGKRFDESLGVKYGAQGSWACWLFVCLFVVGAVIESYCDVWL